MPRQDHVLAVDIGSSSLRAARYDRHGRLASAVVRIEYPFRHGGTPGEFAAGEAAGLIERALDEVVRNDVGVVAISSVWQTVLAVDQDDIPISNVYTWESSAAASVVAKLSDALDTDAYSRRTGAYLHPSYPATSIAHIRRTVSNQIWRFSDLTSWAVRHMFGSDVWWSQSIASGSGLWNQQLNDWDADILQALSIRPDNLGPMWTDPMRVPPSARWPELVDVPVLPAMGDGACNSVGSGAIGRRRAALTIGTSGSLRLMLDKAPSEVPKGLWRYRVSDRTTAIGGAISNAGNAWQWLASLFGRPCDMSFAWNSKPPDTGLVVLPHLAGERGPSYRADAVGVISGLTLRHSRGDICRETIMSICCTFAELYDLIALVNGPPDVLVASGGVAQKSPEWVQLISDAANVSIEVAKETEPSLRGAALVGLQWLHDQPPTTETSSLPRIKPRASWTEALRERRKRQQRMPTISAE